MTVNNVMLVNKELRILNNEEIEQVHGAALANIGMGIVRAAGWMAGYGLSSFSSLYGTGFMAAAAGGFIHGASGFSHTGWAAGGLVASSINAYGSGSETGKSTEKPNRKPN